MNILAMIAAAVLAAPLIIHHPPSTPWTPMPTPVQGCCKVCSKGKACGNSCISRDKTCRKGPGCACDG